MGLVLRCWIIAQFVVLLAVAASAQTLKIQGQDLPYRVVAGRQMVSRALLAKAFPGFPDGAGEVDLVELVNDPEARITKRDGLIVSVRYYNDAMAILYQASREPRPMRAEPAQAASVTSYSMLMTEIVRLSNLERQNNGVPSLTSDTFLERAALGHSEEMMKLNYFEHISPTAGRETPDTRIRLAGSAALRTGENLALLGAFAESELARTAVTGWMNSPGHRRNLLDPDFTHIGIGIAKGANGQYYITQNLGAY